MLSDPCQVNALTAKGYTARAARIRLTSLDDDVAVTQRLLSARPEGTVLVGHSYGGAVISGAAGIIAPAAESTATSA